jgi:hypothetical protein
VLKNTVLATPLSSDLVSTTFEFALVPNSVSASVLLAESYVITMNLSGNNVVFTDFVSTLATAHMVLNN